MGEFVMKCAGPEEAQWTLFLAPKLFLGYTRGLLFLRRLPGPTLGELTKDPHPWHLALERLAYLHRRATSKSAPPLPEADKWESSLKRAWNYPTDGVTQAERVLLASLDTLFRELERVNRTGIFLDANPRNWVVVDGRPIAIDFGHVARASFASDLSQLLDYQKSPIATARGLRVWANAFDEPRGAAAASYDYPIISIFSALCRAPYHPQADRAPWYCNAAPQALALGMKVLATQLRIAAESVEEKNETRAARLCR